MSLLDYFRPEKGKKGGEKIEPETTSTTETVAICTETVQREQQVVSPEQELLAKLRLEHAEAIRILSEEGWETPVFCYDEELQEGDKVLLRIAIHENNGKKTFRGLGFKMVKPGFEIQFENLFKLPAHTLEQMGIPMCQQVLDQGRAQDFDRWLDKGQSCSQRDYYSGRNQYDTEKFIYKISDEIPAYKCGEEYSE